MDGRFAARFEGWMMATTKRDLQAIHYLAQRAREDTTGAGEWHDQGLWIELVKFEGHSLASVIERLRHAFDPEARTPAALSRKFAAPDHVPGPPTPPKVHEACHTCGQHVTRCTCPEPNTTPPRARKGTPMPPGFRNRITTGDHQ